MADIALLTDQDIYLFNEGTHAHLFEHMGAQVRDGGTHFAVWAPNAVTVSVVGDFNQWDAAAHPLLPSDAGIWKGFIPEARPGNTYKYLVSSRSGGAMEKADPFAFTAEVAPKTASVVWDLTYEWGDAEWMRDRGSHNRDDAPMAIYELHIGSWAKKSETASYS